MQQPTPAASRRHGGPARGVRAGVAVRRVRCFCAPQQRQQDALIQQRLQQLQAPACAPAAHATAAASSSDSSSSSRRHLLASLAAVASLTSISQPARAADAGNSSSSEDLEITHRIFLDVGVASSAFKPAGERTLGDKTVLPNDAEPVGRIVIGLYGKLAPASVANLVTAVRAGAFTGSAFSRISPGEYIQAGKQGSRRLGDIDPPPGLLPNTDLAAPGPFRLTHSRPGTVSLSLSENDEDPAARDKPDYRGLEFLITTGPGPVPRLDGLNPVIGRVEDGLATVARLAQVPSFQPDIRSQQLNRFAAFLGDERADNVRRQYGRPLKAIVILDSGVLGDSSSSSAQLGARALAAGSIVEVP